MLFFGGLILLTIAVSLDSFGVGVTYGMRRIRVPFISLLIIMLCSGVMVLTSMTIGSLLSSFISADFAGIIGSLILISIGLFSLYNVIRSKKNIESIEENPITKNEPEEIEWKLEIKKLGLFITVLKKPLQADLDRSGTISAKEAVLLGFALALDAFGAGLGAAMLGYSPFVTAMLVALMSGLFVFFGIKSGFVLSKRKWMQQLAFLPPCLLITFGLFKML
ncbi:sporulation membrane protein YtaF [Paenibacillus alkaliterrae]|uniref:sporulation membrane protein YtaF n=1 Tax=Paenibacillus alkaliterrae TaxID=320909 RepID=UPI001F436FC4|nr:sporulation membrane protein YtaF [Paenibacillus alkaliterrae]MCF2940097.1 sporulation membrane protein YtaF [Paenibacillus alkaliterrae]